jgi:hypothetical protein
MAESSNDEGIIEVLLDRFETQRLPRILRLKEKVDGGEAMSDMDIAFLDQVLQDAKHIKSVADNHPEYQNLVVKAISLYQDITEQALNNEQNSTE